MLSAWGFLTVFGPARQPNGSTLYWFPLVGAAIGGLLGGVWWTADELFGPAVAAALVVGADLVLTGCLHIDGLADSSDGLLGHAERSRRLEIMADPHVGAFALAIVPTVLLIRWSALWSQPVEPLVLVGLWALARSLVAAAPALVPYARSEGGLASPFLAGARWWIALGALPAAALLVFAVGGDGALAAAGTILAMTAVLALSRSRLGGFTGDVLGAAIVLGETVGLILVVPE